MIELLGKQVRSKKTNRVGKVIGYDPGSSRTDTIRGVRPGVPFLVVKTDDSELERLHEDDYILE